MRRPVTERMDRVEGGKERHVVVQKEEDDPSHSQLNV
jgi:hypothetical protein